MAEESYEFADLLTGHQQRIYRYIAVLLGDAALSWDVLQETNRVLLEKRAEFRVGTDFVSWALTVAQFQTLAWLRNQKRDRLIVTPEIVDLLADDAQALDENNDARIDALQACVQELSKEHQQLLNCRYTRSEQLTAMSERTGRTVNALKQLFFRLRESLERCVQRRLEREQA